MQKAAKPTKAAKGKGAEKLVEEEEVNVLPPAKAKKEAAVKGKKAAQVVEEAPAKGKKTVKVVEELPAKGKKGKAQPPAPATPAAKKQAAAFVKNGVGKGPAVANGKGKQALKRSIVQEDSDDDDDEEEEDGESDAEEMEIDEDDSDEQEQEEDDDEDDEEGDEDDDEEDENDNSAELDADDSDAAEDGDDAESDDEDKKPKTKKQKAVSASKIPEINFKFVPNGTPDENVVKVRNLPEFKSYTHMDLAEIFYKYGKITAIVTRPERPDGSQAWIAYDSAEAAEAALAGNEKEKFGNKTLTVVSKTSIPKKDFPLENIPFADRIKKMVKVKNVNKITKAQDLREHFAECGAIIHVSLYSKVPKPFAEICFESEEAAEKALKLDGTELLGSQLEVKNLTIPPLHSNYDEEHTIMVVNNQKFKTFEESKLRAIFEKCGEIESIVVACRKFVLAFIHFVEPAAAAKALALNGKTVDGLTLELKRFDAEHKTKTIIFVENLHSGTTEDDIRKHFKDTGEIDRVTMRSGFSAIVSFKDSDAYCKAFLLDESFLRGRMIFITPFSMKRRVLLKRSASTNSFGGKKFNTKGPFLKRGGPPNKRARMAA